MCAVLRKKRSFFLLSFFYQHVGGTLWRARGRDYRLRQAIHLCPPGRAVSEPQDQLHDYPSIPPQSNGMVERTHRQIKDALCARLEDGRWPEHPPWVLFGLRAASKEDCAISPAELVFGAPLTLTGQLLSPPETLVEDMVEALQNSQPLPTLPLTYVEAASSFQSLQQEEFV